VQRQEPLRERRHGVPFAVEDADALRDCKVVSTCTLDGCSAKPFVVAIMALWDEALTLPLALDSTRHFVTEYIVVHKLGTDNTAEVLRACIAKWKLNVRYIASNMTLREARMYALDLSRPYADIYIIQDGDEVFYSSGRNAVQNALPLIYGAGYKLIRSKMVYLKHDLRYTMKDGYKPGAVGKWGGHTSNGIMLIDHPTIFPNIPELIHMPANLALDVPEMATGEVMVTHAPWKFDLSIKHPLREFLRQSFLDWSKAGSPGTIEEWATKNDQIHRDLVKAGRSVSLEQSAAIYTEENTKRWLQAYSEEEWFRYPDAVKKYVDAGRFRGYDGGEIL
jgi:hypothetical protein